jgi:hypothetical protein
MLGEALRDVRPGSDLTIMHYLSPEGGREKAVSEEGREQIFVAIMEQLNRGKIREYKRIICFDHHVLANDPELKSGVLRVGEGPGTIDRNMAEHYRLMMQTKGCSLYVAPAVFRHIVGWFGTDKVSISVETVDQGGTGTVGELLFFSDPPNGEIVEQFRELERETERRMVAVHKIVFPEDAVSTAEVAAR